MGRTSDAAERLVEAMAYLAHRRGYADVGVDDVCREAGVKKGSFYHFFPSKRALMLAALERQQRTLAAMMQRALDASAPPLARIEALAQGVVDLERGHRATEGIVLGCPFGRIAAEVGRDEAELAQAADAAFCGFTAMYEQLLRAAQASGDLDTTVNVCEAAEAMMAYTQGLLLVAKTRNDPSVLARLLPKALQLASPSPAWEAPHGRAARRATSPAAKPRRARR